MLAKWMGPIRDRDPLRLFRTLSIHGELASRMGVLGAGLLGHPRVKPREREIVIQRITARCGAEYEWGVHAEVFAESVGLGERSWPRPHTETSMIRSGPNATAF